MRVGVLIHQEGLSHVKDIIVYSSRSTPPSGGPLPCARRGLRQSRCGRSRWERAVGKEPLGKSRWRRAVRLSAGEENGERCVAGAQRRGRRGECPHVLTESTEPTEPGCWSDAPSPVLTLTNQRGLTQEKAGREPLEMSSLKARQPFSFRGCSVSFWTWGAGRGGAGWLVKVKPTPVVNAI